jgi:hypothetical protein
VNQSLLCLTLLRKLNTYLCISCTLFILVHLLVITTTGSVPILVDSWSLQEYQYMCLLSLPLGRYPSWWTVGPSTSTSTCVCYHYHWVGTRLGGQLVPPRVPVHVFVITTDILSLIKNSISPTYWALSLLVSC